MTHDTAYTLLSGRLTMAQEQEKHASAQFKEIVAQVPSGIPPPDGTARVERAARVYRSALHELHTAQERLANFLLTGVAPHDLDEPARPN